MSKTNSTETTHPDDEESLIVVMDGFGGDWTPFSAFYDADEALQLREMLSEDADAECQLADYYPSKQAARDNEPTPPPRGLDEVVVAFNGADVVGVSAEDMAAREAQFEFGGARGAVDIYDTAEDVVEKNPSAIGQFVASEMTADDLLDVIR